MQWMWASDRAVEPGSGEGGHDREMAEFKKHTAGTAMRTCDGPGRPGHRHMASRPDPHIVSRKLRAAS